MSHPHGLLVLFAACALSACTTSVTEPVAVIGPKGMMLRGTATASLTGGGSFTASNGKITCAGSYNSLDASPTISMPVQCNDGRKGIIIATRNGDGLSGAGHVKLNDGSEADFIFGPAAASF